MTASVLRIVLDTHGYSAIVLQRESQIWALAAVAHACLVVGLTPLDAERIEQRLYREFACAGVIACRRGVAPEGLWIAQLLEQVHRVTIRKRGPVTGRLHATARESGANAARAMAKRSGKEAAA